MRSSPLFLFVSLVVIRLLIFSTFASAASLGYLNPTSPQIQPAANVSTGSSVNNNTLNVNNSQYLQGYTPFNLCNANNSYCSTYNASYITNRTVPTGGATNRITYWANAENVTSNANFYRDGSGNIVINDSGGTKAGLTVSGTGDGGTGTNFIIVATTTANKVLCAFSDSANGVDSYGVLLCFGNKSKTFGGGVSYIAERDSLDFGVIGDKRVEITQILYDISKAKYYQRTSIGQVPSGAYNLQLQSDGLNCVGNIENCNKTLTVHGNGAYSDDLIVNSLSYLEPQGTQSSLEVLGIVSGGMCSGTPLECSLANYPTIAQCDAVACTSASGGACSDYNGNEATCTTLEGCSYVSTGDCSGIGDEGTCNGAGGGGYCSWDTTDPENPYCAGSTYPIDECQGSYYDSCTGTPTTCESYGDEGTCTTYPDCLWGGETQKAQYNEGDNNFTDGITYTDETRSLTNVTALDWLIGKIKVSQLTDIPSCTAGQFLTNSSGSISCATPAGGSTNLTNLAFRNESNSFAGNLTPRTNNTYDIGNYTHRWRQGFIVNLSVGDLNFINGMYIKEPSVDLTCMYNATGSAILCFNGTSTRIIGDGSGLTNIAGGNASWNESRANILYAPILWGYNQTTPANTYTDSKTSQANLHLHNWNNLTNIPSNAVVINADNLTTGTLAYARLPSLTNAIQLNLSNITGTDDNACTGTDKVSNVTFMNGQVIITCTADQTGGAGGGIVDVAQRRDLPTTSNTLFNMTSLGFVLEANKNYSMRCDLLYTSAVATTGMVVNLSSTAPASITDLEVSYDTWSSATGKVGFSTTTLATALTGTGSGVGVIYTSRINAGLRTTGATAINISTRSEISASLMTLKRGSTCVLYDVT